MGFTLDKIMKLIKGKKPFGSGKEGEVYKLTDGLVVKVRNRDASSVYQPENNLSEFERAAIHSAVNLLEKKIPIINECNENKPRARLLDVKAAFVHGKKSISVSEYVAGIDGSHRWFDSEELFNAFRLYGAVLDNYVGHNTKITTYNNKKNIRAYDVIVLETIGLMCPEILKTLEKVEKEDRKPVLEHVARAHLLDATSLYPTPEEMMVVPYIMFPLGCTWRDLDILYPYMDKIDKARKKKGGDGIWLPDIVPRREYEKLSTVGRGCEGIDYARWAIGFARETFGEQFIPQRFDWEEGKTLENYSIDSGIFHEFRLYVDKLKPEIAEIKRHAEIESKMTTKLKNKK